MGLPTSGALAVNPYSASPEAREQLALIQEPAGILKTQTGLRVWLWMKRRDAEQGVRLGRPPLADMDLIMTDLRKNSNEYQSAVAGNDPVARNLLDDTFEVDMHLFPDSAQARYKAALMEKVVDRMAHSTRARVPLVLMAIPSMTDLIPGYPGRILMEQAAEYVPERLCGNLEDIAKRLAIPRLNLYPVFEGYDPSRLYFLVDGHWNEAGQDLAASSMATYLSAAGISPAAGMSFPSKASGSSGTVR